MCPLFGGTYLLYAWIFGRKRKVVRHLIVKCTEGNFFGHLNKKAQLLSRGPIRWEESGENSKQYINSKFFIEAI